MDLGGWLRNLGLEQYEAVFRENAIDDTVLHDLTENHLREIGIPLGARLKLLKAIAALGVGAEATSPSAEVTPLGPPIDSAERRQVTVVFSDLVGSTALSACMDPEDLREVIAAYHKCTAEIVRRFGGFVSQYLGDGVLVYFGYPEAHEDDAERAVRAGLELIAEVGGLNTRVLLQTRVGIATGVVISAILSMPEARKSAVSSGTLRIWRRASRDSPDQIWSSSPRAPESFSAISSSFRTSEPKRLRVSPDTCVSGRRCGQALSRAVSRHCTRPA
jgi:hypothetical protein